MSSLRIVDDIDGIPCLRAALDIAALTLRLPVAATTTTASVRWDYRRGTVCGEAHLVSPPECLDSSVSSGATMVIREPASAQQLDLCARQFDRRRPRAQAPFLQFEEDGKVMHVRPRLAYQTAERVRCMHRTLSHRSSAGLRRHLDRTSSGMQAAFTRLGLFPPPAARTDGLAGLNCPRAG